jgi:phosphopantothenoylcysteine synthetase/decarboxylase
MGGGECTRCRVQERRVPGIQTDVVAFGAPSERSEMTSFQDEDMETRDSVGQGSAEAPSDTDDQDDTDSTDDSSDDADSSDSDTDSTDADTDSTDPS